MASLLMTPLLVLGQFRLGPAVGGSITRMHFPKGDDSDLYSSRLTTGYHGGLAANYWVNDRYSLHTEWLYLYRQKDVSYNKGSVMVRDKASLHYLAIPVLYRVSFHSKIKKSHQEWYLNAGPAVHYWLGGSGTLHSNEQSPYLEGGRMDYKVKFGAPGEFGSTEYIEPANRWQIALYAGGGMIFDLGFGRHLWLDARTSLGAAKSYFSPSAKGDYGLNLYEDNLQSSISSWSITAGFFQDVNFFSVFKKGKSVKKKKAKKLKKHRGPATSG